MFLLYFFIFFFFFVSVFKYFRFFLFSVGFFCFAFNYLDCWGFLTVAFLIIIFCVLGFVKILSVVVIFRGFYYNLFYWIRYTVFTVNYGLGFFVYSVFVFLRVWVNFWLFVVIFF